MRIPIVYGDDRSPGEGQPGMNLEGSSPAADTPSAGPSVEEPIPAEVRVQELEAALAQKTQAYAAVHEQLLRLGAEFDNYRKRMARQFEDAKRFAAADVVTGLLPVVGIPLPMVSYGGSALLTALGAVALLENVRMRRFA